MIEKIGRQFQRKRSPANFVTLACPLPDSNRTGDCGFAVATQSKASAMVNVALVIATGEYFSLRCRERETQNLAMATAAPAQPDAALRGINALGCTSFLDLLLRYRLRLLMACMDVLGAFQRWC